MKLSEIKENDAQLDELLPALGAIGGAVAKGATALAKGVGSAVSKGVNAMGQAAQATGLAGGGMDPAQAAQAKKDHDEQKKQIQDAIRAKQQELADLQKQLAQIG